MKHLRNLLAPALVLSAVLASGAHAQSTLPLSAEVRAGVGFPTGDFADGPSTGWNVGASLHYALQPNLSLYAGFQHDNFSVDDEGEDVDVSVQENGFRAGARVSIPLAAAPVRPWFEAGAIFNRTTFSGSDGSVSASIDSDWKIGFEAGAGFAFDLSPRVALTPGVRYRQHSVSFDELDEEATGDVTYVVVDLGVLIHL